MVKVISSVRRSKVPFVNVEVKGVSETMRFINRKGMAVVAGGDWAMFQAANLIQQEIQESIMGNRDEPKSVDTGDFANSIDIDKISKAKYEVFSDIPYAEHLEFGTSRIVERRHFRNSVDRVNKKAGSIVNKAVKQKI